MWISFRFTLLVFFLACFALLFSCETNSCSGRPDTSYRGNWLFEGWACQPDLLKAQQGISPAAYCSDDDQNEYLYLKFESRAAARTIAQNNVALIKSSCRRKARNQFKGDGLIKILSDQFTDATSEINGEAIAHAIVTQSEEQKYTTEFIIAAPLIAIPVGVLRLASVKIGKRVSVLAT